MFDFDEFVDRRNTAAVKWTHLPDGGKEVIPMWVADMDFRVAPCITAALKKRMEHDVFGYVDVPQEYYDAVINWYKRRHNWAIQREWIQYTTGVVPAVSAVIKALTEPGDKVAILTPIYNCFFSSINNNGCVPLEIPLLQDENGRYTIDFDLLDRELKPKDVKILLFCNPHNPAGRVWTPQELRQVGDIALKNDVIVLSDEIHCELVMPNFEFTPMASLGEKYLNNTVTCSSPSKNFNTAGLQVANIISNRPDLQQRIDRAININETCDVNPFGVVALIAAYNEGEQWLDELNRYIYQNYLLLLDYFKQHLPQAIVTPLEGTYLAWVDIRFTRMSSDSVAELLLNEAKVMVNSGTMYGGAGEGFIRLNMALPKARLVTALQRIITTLNNIK